MLVQHARAFLGPAAQEVLKAIQSGQIASPSSTSSQSDDDSETSMDDDYYYGPSIYTVNEQYIKPVTAHAGKMSWALMRNPYGLKCDLFVSHAWQEHDMGLKIGVSRDGKILEIYKDFPGQFRRDAKD